MKVAWERSQGGVALPAQPQVLLRNRGSRGTCAWDHQPPPRLCVLKATKVAVGLIIEGRALLRFTSQILSGEPMEMKREM